MEIKRKILEMKIKLEDTQGSKNTKDNVLREIKDTKGKSFKNKKEIKKWKGFNRKFQIY